MKDNPTPISGKSQWVLTKESPEETLRKYFLYILNLAESGEQFPANLENVWRICYTHKSDAMAALRRDFVEGYDYQVLRQSPQNPQGGRPADEYYFSQSCLEFFIARKVREVFEVYRDVFHKTYAKAKQEVMTKQPSAPKKRVNKTLIEAAAAGIQAAKNLLNLSDTACASMLNNMYKAYELPYQIDYLPSADEQPLGTMTELLKEHGFSISTKKVNKLMVEKGLAKLFTHKGHKGDKVFPVLIGDGLNYGKNDINPNSPKTTQPHYLRSKFLSLMDFLGVNSDPQQLSLPLSND